MKTMRGSFLNRPRGGRVSIPRAKCLAVILLCGFVSCSKSPDQPKTSELQPTPITSSSAPPSFPAVAQATPAPGQAMESGPPKTDEVVATVARVFDKATKLDQTRTPSFLAGDFNGDGSEDLAVITRASDDGLAEINNELANWTLEDPKDVPIPGTPEANQLIRPKPVKAEKNDLLLAIIHGVGAAGWRNRDARQTYLLRSAVGTSAVVESPTQLRSAPLESKLPPLRGDAIVETVNGKRGLIFWTGAKYAWAPQ